MFDTSLETGEGNCQNLLICVDVRFLLLLTLLYDVAMGIDSLLPQQIQSDRHKQRNRTVNAFFSFF